MNAADRPVRVSLATLVPDHSDEHADAARLSRDLAASGFMAGRLGIAVSGGSDSLALLLLAQAALPGRIVVATVDHGVRAEAADEARFVAGLCAARNIPHATLTVSVTGRDGPQGNARAARYAALAAWAAAEGLAAVATAHHADDRAETLFMRLARGSGVGGLAGVRAARPLAEGIALVRPLLGWRRAELAAIVAAAGIVPVTDPSNADPRYDRTWARGLLAGDAGLDPVRLAAAAAHLAEAEAALDWAANGAWDARIERDGAGLRLDPAGLPDEIVRRLLLRAIAELGGPPPTGPALARAMAALRDGGVVTLSGMRIAGAAYWTIAPAPPRNGH